MFDPRNSAAPARDGRRPGRHQRLQGALRVAALAAVLLLTTGATSTAATAAAHATPAAPGGGTVAEHVDHYLATQLKDSAIAGAAVALTHGDQVLLVRGYGHDSTGAAVTANSLFRVASLSKSFTALAVMQLVEAGRVNLDDRVQQHLPEFRMADPRAARITVRQLLNQTSGLSDTVVPDLSRRAPTDPKDATTSLRTAHLASDPGTQWAYSNANYEVAARLVEVLSEQDFNQYMTRHVFAPAHMSSTTSTVTDNQPVPGLVGGHLVAYGHAFPTPAFGTYTAGDGGIVSSATDMAQWLVVNSNDGQTTDGTRLVSSRGIQLLHSPSAPGSRYALGWATRGPANAPTRIDHSGSLLTFTAQQAVWPGTGYGVVLLFNSGSPMAFDTTALSYGVFDIIEGKTPPAKAPHLTRTVDAVLAATTVLALLLGGLGVMRANRWARRRGGPVRTTVRLMPSVLVLAVVVAFPRLAELLMGRDVTWKAAAYEWPALIVSVAAAAVAAMATVLARAWAVVAVRRATPQSTPTGPPSHRPSHLTNPENGTTQASHSPAVIG